MQKIKTIFKQIFEKIAVFFKDHWYLLFKSAEENNLRIQRLKREQMGNGSSTSIGDSIGERKTGSSESSGGGALKEGSKFSELSSIKGGENTNLKFDSLTHLKKYRKKVRVITFSSSFTAVLVLAIVIGFQFFGSHSKGAVFGWIQSTWTGGADTVNFPNHTSNQTNWTKYYSKDATVSAGAKVSLSASSGTSTQTTDADFNAWTKTNGYVKAGTNSITQLKSPGATCAAAAECASGICTSSVCKGKWLGGTCLTNNAIYVYATDSAAATWGPSSSCTSPQCATGLDPAYPANSALVVSNGVDFSSFPARNACKALGGRLPTVTELTCMYINRASYGLPSSGLYWSSVETNASYAWYFNFLLGAASYGDKNYAYSVRCVRGQ